MYKLNFAMKTYHNYSLEELENQFPFERDIFVHLMIDHLEKKKKEK